MARHAGDSALSVRVGVWVIIVGVLGATAGALSALVRDLDMAATFERVLIGGVGSALIAFVMSRIVLSLSEIGTLVFTQGVGRERPAGPPMSAMDALYASGDIDGAVKWCDEAMVKWPNSAPLMLRAAGVRKQIGDFTGARDLLRDVQRMRDIDVAPDVEASYRLMDLYDGQLAEPGRVLSELRRLADRYPNSATAERALDALARRKSEMGPTASD